MGRIKGMTWVKEIMNICRNTAFFGSLQSLSHLLFSFCELDKTKERGSFYQSSSNTVPDGGSVHGPAQGQDI
jgi:hypothetical protein